MSSIELCTLIFTLYLCETWLATYLSGSDEKDNCPLSLHFAELEISTVCLVIWFMFLSILNSSPGFSMMTSSWTRASRRPVCSVTIENLSFTYEETLNDVPRTIYSLSRQHTMNSFSGFLATSKNASPSKSTRRSVSLKSSESINLAPELSMTFVLSGRITVFFSPAAAV